jgi:type IV fimbrial biogenesis protein FimT
MTANGTSCATSGSWEQGWIVLQGTTLLQYYQPSQIPTGFKVIRTVGTGAMTFQPIGVGATAATFKVCRLTPLGSQERIVTVSATGSANVTTTETGSCS